MSKSLDGFKVGDRVKCIEAVDDNENIVGKVGTIIDIKTSATPPISISFDDDIDGHNCTGMCEVGHGWCVYANSIIHLEEEKPTSLLNCEDILTDPNTDYESVSEKPVYFEFVNVGEALNKLKNLEHYNTVSYTAPKYIGDKRVAYYVRDGAIFVALISKEEYRSKTLTKVTASIVHDMYGEINADAERIFDTIEDALDYIARTPKSAKSI